MYKNQLQELAQRSCFNLPSYACIREGPDHAPRFRASVNFNGEIFEGPSYCTTLRQAEHAAAEVALSTLSTRGPPKSLAAKVLDETGVYKNLLQETAHRAGLNLPVYTTVRSGPGHMPVFTCIVELAGMTFNGDPAKTKKQAEKNAAMAAWSALKQLPNLNSLFQISKESDNGEEQEQVIVARALSSLRPKDETNKAVRQREHQQNLARKRMMMNYKDKYLIHSQTSLQCQRWGSPDLLSELPSYTTQQQPQQQQGVFVSISAPRACSKLLPPVNIYHQQQQKPKESPSQSSGSVCSKEAAPPPSLALNQTRAIPVQIRSKPQVRAEEVPPPIEEHQRDEEEWLNGRKTEQHVPSKAIEKEASPSYTSNAFRPQPNFSRPFLPLNLQPEQNTEPTLIRSLKNFRVPAPPPMAHRSPILPPRMFCGSDFPSHAMAPAVHIRSVIPVCAAPPVRPPSPSPPPPPEQVQKQEASCSNAQDISQAASKMNSLSI